MPTNPNIFGAGLIQVCEKPGSMTTADLSLDSIYGILSEARRRYVLYYFLENEHANVEGLSVEIAAWEQGASIDTVSEEAKKRVTTSLIHSHLPKLADHDLIEYDARTGDIVVSSQFDEIRETVELAKATGDDVQPTGSSTESFLYSEPITRSSNTDQCS